MVTFGELLDNLFHIYLSPDGRQYTLTEVCEGMGGEIAPSYLSRLRAGKIVNPGRETILGLCRFFNVSPVYFFPELDVRNLALPKLPVPNITLTFQGDTLSGQALTKLEELIAILRETNTGQ
jgi:transcriptional regulator with XRE-family HTH domain